VDAAGRAVLAVQPATRKAAAVTATALRRPHLEARRSGQGRPVNEAVLKARTTPLLITASLWAGRGPERVGDDLRG
jgi:hypothetical protein